MERWTRAVLRRRLLVVGIWLVCVIAGTLAALRLGPLLSVSLAVPGTSSETADTILAEHFGDNPDGTFTVVFRVEHPTAREVREVSRRLERISREIPTARSGPLSEGHGIVYGDVTTALSLQRASSYTDTLRQALARSGLPRSYVTGEPAIQTDLTPVLAHDLRTGELIAAPVVLLVLALSLGRTRALVVPFVIAGCTIATALGIVFVLAHGWTMASYIPNLVELIGLGLAVDYSFLLIHRFREEHSGSASVSEAVVATMVSAGRAVVFSGIAVVIGLSAILIVPVPFIRSVAIAGLLVPLVSLAATLTLQPVLLSLLGGSTAASAPKVAKSPTRWARFGAAVIAHRRAVLTGAIALLALLIAPVAGLELTPGSIFAIPHSTPSAQGEGLLLRSVGAGALTPTHVVIDAGAPGEADSRAITAATFRLADELVKDREVFLVQIGTRPPNVDPSRRYRQVIVSGRHEFGSEQSQALVRALRDRFVPDARFPAGVRVSTGGAPAEGVDFLSRSYAAFPWALLLTVVLTYLVLLRAFRSVILPLVTIVIDAASVAVAYAMLVLVFRLGLGSDVLGLYHVSQIEGWIPIFLFAVLFGLSMDYEVFLVSRMREAFDDSGDASAAVVRGIERTGGVITAAALIMVVTFAGFVVGRVADLQEFGVGLALGVALDVTVVRLLLLPSLVSLIGPRSFWLPGPLAHAMRVPESRTGRDDAGRAGDPDPTGTE